MSEAGAAAVLTVDLGAIVANYRLLKRRLGEVPCAAVVKADAYGLGADRVAPALAAAGCRLFFVAQPDEGTRLRKVLPEAEIAVLNGVMAGEEESLQAARLVPVLNDLGQIARWSERAKHADAWLPAMVHIDTGMNRLGLEADEVDRLAAAPELLAGIELRYWMSHLACADDPAHPKNAEQRTALRNALARLPAAPVTFANSSGIFLGPDYHFDLGRPGAALYGLQPQQNRPNPLQTVVHLRGRIQQLRRVDSPMTVGYGATHRFAQPGRIATIAVGYADGFLRQSSNRGSVAIGGDRVPVVGRVSMDLITADVTSLPEAAVQPGDWAELIGPTLPPDTVAASADTIGYEILTALGRRYTRRYLG
jgi:alanine racemase